MSNMNVIDYILIFIVIIFIILIVLYYKKLNYICGVLDEILVGNLN